MYQILFFSNPSSEIIYTRPDIRIKLKRNKSVLDQERCSDGLIRERENYDESFQFFFLLLSPLVFIDDE